MIDGVLVEPLQQFPDERGSVLRMIRADAPFFQRFGEVYFSTVHPGKVKAWRRHHRMTQHFAVPSGRIRLVLYDAREASPSRGKVESLEVGTDHYVLVRIPPGIWYGFQGLASATSIVANCTDLVHDPAESDRAEPTDPKIPYRWPRT